MESFRHHAGYLVPDAARTAALRSRYRSRGGRLVVGISWRSTNRLFGQRKSVPLADWEPILDLPGITFVALQHGDIADEAAAAGLLHDREIDPLVDLDGFAAQTAAMDLVVSVSNSTVHFAGALARPCWLMLPSGNGLLWHWQLCRAIARPGIQLCGSSARTARAAGTACWRRSPARWQPMRRRNPPRP